MFHPFFLWLDNFTNAAKDSMSSLFAFFTIACRLCLSCSDAVIFGTRRCRELRFRAKRHEPKTSKKRYRDITVVL
jgi:hypothetical protein